MDGCRDLLTVIMVLMVFASPALATGNTTTGGCIPPDMCVLVPPFTLTGGVTVEGSVEPLDMSLLSCEPRHFENIVEYLEAGREVYCRFNDFYMALATDLAIAQDTLDAHCKVCERTKGAFEAKGYSQCGGPLSDVGNGTVDPSACANAAKAACPGQCGSGVQTTLPGSCPICDGIPCKSGGSCFLQRSSLPLPVRVYECARLLGAVNDACTLGSKANVCELAEEAGLLRTYLEDNLLILLPGLVQAMDEMAGKVRNGTTNGTATEPLKEEVEGLLDLVNATFKSAGLNITEFQTRLKKLIAVLADPAVPNDIGKGGHRVKAEGVLLSGDGAWKEYCEGFAVGKCFGRSGKEPPGPGDGDDGNETEGVCKHETAEECNGRDPHCSWVDGRCFPSCGAWLVHGMGFNDAGHGCRKTACPGQGDSGVAWDCDYCCETWEVNGNPVYENPNPQQLEMSGLTSPSWLDDLDQSILRPRRAFLLQAEEGDNGGGSGNSENGGDAGGEAGGDTMALISLRKDHVKFYKFKGPVHEKTGGHLDPMTWGTPRITGMVAVDVDGDGRDELAINFETDDNIWFYRWDGTIHEKSGEQLDGMGWGDPHLHWAAAGDFDGDGTDELAVNYQNDDHVHFYRWKGEIKARDGPRLQTESGDIFWGTVAGDFDGDGTDELAVHFREDRFRFYKWNGEVTSKGSDGKWGLEEHPGVYMGIRIWKHFPEMAAGDFNGDGRTELAIRYAKGKVKFYRWDGAVERRNADYLDADCGSIEKQCKGHAPFYMLGGDFDGNGEGDIVVFVNRLIKSTTVMFYAWDGMVSSATANHIDAGSGKYVLLAAVRAAPAGTEGNDTEETQRRVVTPEEYPDACPPGECGACRATALPLDIEIANLDAYKNAAKEVVDVLATVDPERLFIKDGTCLTYTTPGMDCASVCRRCHGASASHCHAQAGVCVCEEGLTWHTTNVQCEAEDREDGRLVLACCARLFNVTMALDYTRLSANGTDECIPTAEGIASPYFERCQTASSDTGWCCFDGFEELPATQECIDQGLTCGIACLEEFPANGTLQARCVDKCRNAPIDEEEEEEEEEDPEEEELEEPIKDCMEECLAVNSTEVCQRMCHALAPDLDVIVTLLRGEEPVRAMYVGEMLRASVRVRNRGLLTVSGNVSLSFQVQVNCTCPPCVRGESCPCSCDEYKHPVAAGLRLGTLRPDAERVIPVQPFRVNGRFTNLTLAPLADVRFNGELLGYDRGDIHGVFIMDNLTVVNVHFVTPQGERTTRSYPGTTTLGEVTLVTTVFPLTGNLTVMRNDGPVNGSLTEVTIDQPGAHTLRTPVINITNEMAGQVLGLRAELHDVNGSVLTTTFSSQGEVLNECAGRSLTSWCREDLAYLATLYPHAYLEVARPSLLLRDAYFTDTRGVRTNRLYRPEPVKGHIEIGNPEPVAFIGELLLRPVDASGSFLDEQVHEPDITLDPKAVRLFETPLFTPVAGESYRLLVTGAPPDAEPWLDELVDPAAHPFAELEVGLISLEGEEGRIATIITTGNCTREVTCEDCLPTCRFRLSPRTCELVQENCACGCAIT